MSGLFRYMENGFMTTVKLETNEIYMPKADNQLLIVTALKRRVRRYHRHKENTGTQTGEFPVV